MGSDDEFRKALDCSFDCEKCYKTTEECLKDIRMILNFLLRILLSSDDGNSEQMII